MSKRANAALASGVGVIALAATYLVGPWEGTKNLAYWDQLGQTWTVCTGETKGVKKGDRYTDQQCAEMLYATLEKDYHRPLQKCIPGFDAGPLSWQASFLSLTYNIGAGAACTSTAAKRGRVGDYEGSCQAMTWFNKAGGKTIRGLKLRREMGDVTRIGELELCLAGLDMPAVAVPNPPKPEPRPNDVAVPAPAEPVSSDRGSDGTLIGLGLALVLAAGAVVLIVMRRKRRK